MKEGHDHKILIKKQQNKIFNVEKNSKFLIFIFEKRF